MADEPRLPLRNAIHRRAAPVVPAEHDARRAELLAQRLDGVGVRLEAEVAQVRRRARVAVAHAVECDAAEAEAGEERDLVAPGEGAVWEAVDQDRGALLLAAGDREVEVGWEDVVSWVGIVRGGGVVAAVPH